MNRPLEIKMMTSMRLGLLFSRPNKMANKRMKMMHVDLVIVYKLIVMNSNEKFDRPMSSELTTPTIDSLRT